MSSTQPLMPRRYATRAAFTGLANAGASALAAAVALPLLLAALGVERYGEWAVLGMFVTGAAALDLGMARALVLHCAAQPAERVRECATAAVMFAAGIAALTVLVIAAVALSKAPGSGIVTPAVLTAGGCVLVFGMLNGVMRAVLESQLAVHWVNIGYLLQTLLLYGFALAAAVAWPVAVLPATVCAFAAVAAFNALLLARFGLLAPRRPSRITFAGMLSTAWSSFLLAAPIAVLPPLTSLIALKLSSSTGEFAIFDLAQRIATLAATLLSSIAVPLLAVAARARATGDTDIALDRLTLRYLALGWSLYSLGMVTYSLAGPALLEWVFPAAGPELFPIAGAMLAGLGSVAACEAVIRVMLGTLHVRPLFWARLTMLSLVAFAGALATRGGGLTLFTGMYAIAGFFCAIIILVVWTQRRMRH